MIITRGVSTEKNAAVAFILLSIFVFIIYSNTLESSWHFDDYPNIVNNPSLHLTTINKKSILKSFLADPVHHNSIFRPVVSLSFAVNWYYNRDDTTGYHVVNIVFHIFNTFLLFVVIQFLLRTPNMKARYQDDACFISVLAAGLWAINPIQTQAVTYVIQRMTLMATMFYLLSVFFYIQGRLQASRNKRIVYYFCCVIWFALALGSKEISATLPFALLLVEICFFQKKKSVYSRNRHFILAGLLFCIFLAGVITLFFTGDFLFFLKGYKDRPFTFPERLLTEPRVVGFYLSQIFYPIPQRLSFAHDITASTSLFQPWTTFFAICLNGFLIGWGFTQIKKRPLIAFAILFFFLSHLIESTVIPLELVFEHRNYMPSLFLFLPVASGLKALLDYYHRRRKILYFSIISFITMLMILLGMGTYNRNMAWATEISLWADAMKKAPGSARAVQNVAGYYKKNQQYHNALALYDKSVSLYAQRPRQSQALAYNNMGNIYADMGDYEKAVFFYRKAIDIFPSNQSARYNMVTALINKGDQGAAIESIDFLLSHHFYVKESLYFKGLILLQQRKYMQASDYLGKALRLDPHNPDIMIQFGIAVGSMGHHKQALDYFKQAKFLKPDNAFILLCLGEVSLRSGNGKKACEYFDKFCTRVGEENILLFIKNQMSDALSAPLDYALIMPVIANCLKKSAADLTSISLELENMDWIRYGEQNNVWKK